MKKILAFHLLFLVFITAFAGNDTKKYTYESIPNDPSGCMIYTLENGLKVYLSVNKQEPRIQTFIAVKAGSKFDPAETTGLAHYLEHMMFKGTHTIGTKNWEAEKAILDQIAATYEAHRLEPDDAKKTLLYAKIDSLSLEASRFAIANEYDKMVSSLGAKGTNAYTSNDETVYINDIPSNELEKWLAVEGERFQTLVLRLFHTELETVYEEFNRSQDSDNRWVYQGVLEGLLPNHPYGTQTTIGLGEHLKNPSMYNIHDYFNKYYVPNNIAICLAGDLDPDATIAMIEQYFGSWQAKDIEPFVAQKDVPLTQSVVKEVFGPQQEMMYLGFKFDGAGSKEALMIQLVDMLLANNQAGLIDLDLVLKQQVLDAGSFPQVLKDHSIHFLFGVPKEGQALEEVKDLLLAEIEKIKKGEFEDWLLPAVINDLKLQRIKKLETNTGRANLMLDAFINELDYAQVLFEIDSLATISKQDIVAFANQHYKNNYVVSYKRMGESNRHSVPKPSISSVEVDRDSQSTFYENFQKMPSKSLEAKFVDFEKDITKDALKEVPLNYIYNTKNEIFKLYYLFDLGSNTDKELSLAFSYLPYLGTPKYSSEDLQKEFYKYGLEFGASMDGNQANIYLSGLEENLEKGLELFEYLLANVQANQEVYNEMIADIEKNRTNAKLDKNTILRSGLISYAKYGAHNPFTDRLSMETLQTMDVNKLTQKINNLSSYKHRIFYYGQKPLNEVKKVLSKYHKNTKKLKELPLEKDFPELEIEENKVFFADYDMQQVELFFIAKDQLFNPETYAASTLFNEYFGSGLSSIVFQEIREKKALAYAAYSYFSNPAKKGKSHYSNAYIGTQADKLSDATTAMFDLMNNMPEANMQFEGAKEAVLKKLESDWVTGEAIFWQYERAQKLGIDYDMNQKMYEQIKNMRLEDLKAFFEKHIQGKQYSICVIGNKEKLNMDVLKKLGEVEELSLETLFGY